MKSCKKSGETAMARRGSMDQLGYARPFTYTRGAAKGLSAIEVKNGPLRFTLLADKCLYIAEFSQRGMEFDFMARPGLMAPGTPWAPDAEKAARSIMGGMLFTAGYKNIGPANTVDGASYPMHGSLRVTPAQHIIPLSHQKANIFAGLFPARCVVVNWKLPTRAFMEERRNWGRKVRCTGWRRAKANGSA